MMYDENPKAVQVLNELVGRSNATLGSSHTDSLEYTDTLADACERAKDLGKALQLRKDVYLLTMSALGAEHNETLNRSDSLAAAYEKAGRIEEALRQREESLRGRRKESSGPDDLGIGYALQEVARLHEKLHDDKGAEPIWREALPFLKTNENVLVDVLESLGRCLLRLSKPADAEPVLRECLVIREKVGPDDWAKFHTKSLLGGSLLGQKKYTEAEPLLLASGEATKKSGQIAAEEQAHQIEDLERLVQLYEATGKKDKADAWRKILQETKSAAKNPAKP